MIRRLLTLAAALSLLLCIAMAMLWALSYRHDYGIGWARPHLTAFAISHRDAVYCGTEGTVRWRGILFLRQPSEDRMAFSGPAYAGFQFSADIIRIPFWFLTLATATASASCFWRSRGHRSHAGSCSRCGYDLRATPDRCPECGQVPKNAKATA